MRRFVFVLSVVFWSGSIVAQHKPLSVVGTLKQQLIRARHDSTRLRLCVAIGDSYLTGNQFDSLYHYTQRGLRLLTKTPSAYYAGDLYHFLARYYRHRGLYRKGIPLMQQAVEFARQAHSIKKTASFQYTLAMIYSDAGDLSSAVDQIAMNLTYLRDNKDEDMLAANYLLMVELFKVLNNPTMQELYTNRYLALVTPSWPHDHRLFAYELKAEILEKKGRLKKAGAMYRKAMHHARLTNNPVYVIGILNKQGINERDQQHNQAAIQLFSQAFDLSRSIRDIGDMAGSKRELAMTYLATGRPQEALGPARYALALSRQNKQVDGLLASLKSLVVVLEANGRYQEALKVYQEQQELKEHHFSDKNMQKIAQMQAKFEAETKEKTIKILQRNAQINQLRALRQQEQLVSARRAEFAAVIIMCLLMVLMGVVYYFLRKSQRNYQVLTQQQLLLEQTARELAETNAIKDKLFSLIGHDLRSPIASMKLNVRQIQETDKQPELLLPIINRLEKQVDNVLTLLTNLLDWSMIQLKGFQLLLQPVLLHEITEETITQASERLWQKQLIVINQVDKTLLAMADKHQLRAVLRNILDNAIKFTPPGGYIRIQAVAQGSGVELQVRDSGLGMSADQIEKLFSSPDVRSGTMGESGIGLGLRICREMLDRQGGSLHIERRPKGGTLVRIRLAVFADQYQPELSGIL